MSEENATLNKLGKENTQQTEKSANLTNNDPQGPYIKMFWFLISYLEVKDEDLPFKSILKENEKDKQKTKDIYSNFLFLSHEYFVLDKNEMVSINEDLTFINQG